MADPNPRTRLVLVVILAAMFLGACTVRTADTLSPSSSWTTLISDDGLNCSTEERISTIIEAPPADFSGFSSPEDAIAAASSTLDVEGSPIDMSDNVWEVRNGDRATAHVIVQPWGEASWFVAEVTQCGGDQ